MHKISFNLQNAQFSDSDEQNCVLTESQPKNRQIPAQDLFFQYISAFLKQVQCKNSIFKYLYLNQFGVGFNICNIFNHLTKIQVNTCNLSKEENLNKLNNCKSHCQKWFQDIVRKMGQVLQEFLQFQLSFKKEYLGINLSKFNSILQQNGKSFNGILNWKQQKSKEGDYQSLLTQNISQRLGNEKETDLIQSPTNQRKILKEENQSISTERMGKCCDIDSSFELNIHRLERKIDLMKDEVVRCSIRLNKSIQKENISKSSFEKLNLKQKFNQSISKRVKLSKKSQCSKIESKKWKKEYEKEEMNEYFEFEWINAEKISKEVTQPTSSSSIKKYKHPLYRNRPHFDKMLNQLSNK